MCGRYTLAKGEGRWEFAHIRVEWKGPGRFNIAPSQLAPIIRFEDGKPVIRELRWGLVPSWAKDAKIGNSLANARADTVATKPSFRTAFRRRRCLVPADGYYEWQTLGALKQPWRFVRPDREPFLLAGLWETWEDAGKTGEIRETFSLITTEPNAVAARVHDRMPVILSGESAERWLADTASPEKLLELLRPCPESELECYRVGAGVGNPRNDGPQCIEPLPDSVAVIAPPKPPQDPQGMLF